MIPIILKTYTDSITFLELQMANIFTLYTSAAVFVSVEETETISVPLRQSLSGSIDLTVTALKDIVGYHAFRHAILVFAYSI